MEMLVHDFAPVRSAAGLAAYPALPVRRHTTAEKTRLCDLLVERTRAHLAAEGFDELRVDSSSAPGSPEITAVARLDASLADVCDFGERLLKTVLGGLHPNDLGWQNAARLRRMVEADHPRFTYREAQQLLEAEGFDARSCEEIGRAAETAVTRLCADLPVQITGCPAGSRDLDTRLEGFDAQPLERMAYLLPHAGEALRGWIFEEAPAVPAARSHDSGPLRRAEIVAAFERCVRPSERPAPRRIGCSVNVARLVQYVLGCESIEEAGSSLPG